MIKIYKVVNQDKGTALNIEHVIKENEFMVQHNGTFWNSEGYGLVSVQSASIWVHHTEVEQVRVHSEPLQRISDNMLNEQKALAIILEATSKLILEDPCAALLIASIEIVDSMIENSYVLIQTKVEHECGLPWEISMGQNNDADTDEGLFIIGGIHCDGTYAEGEYMHTAGPNKIKELIRHQLAFIETLNK